MKLEFCPICLLVAGKGIARLTGGGNTSMVLWRNAKNVLAWNLKQVLWRVKWEFCPLCLFAAGKGIARLTGGGNISVVLLRNAKHCLRLVTSWNLKRVFLALRIKFILIFLGNLYAAADPTDALTATRNSLSLCCCETQNIAWNKVPYSLFEMPVLVSRIVECSKLPFQFVCSYGSPHLFAPVCTCPTNTSWHCRVFLALQMPAVQLLPYTRKDK